MNARYVQRGDAIDYTPMDDVAAGDVVILAGKLAGVHALGELRGDLADDLLDRLHCLLPKLVAPDAGGGEALQVEAVDDLAVDLLLDAAADLGEGVLRRRLGRVGWSGGRVVGWS